MHMRLLPILIGLLLAVSCARKPAGQPAPTTATIILRDAPEHSSTTRFLGSMHIAPEATLEYVDSLAHLIRYIPRNIGDDTLTIPTYRGYAEITHRNQGIETLHFLIPAGDTVLFTYGADLRPQIRSLTSEKNTWLYNLPYEDERAVQPMGYNTQTVLSNFNYQMADRAVNGRLRRTPPAELMAKFRSYYIDLDSLRPIYDAYVSDYSARLDDLEASGELSSVYADFYRDQLQPPADSTREQVLPLITDSLMHYVSGHKTAIGYAHSLKGTSVEQFDNVAVDTLLPRLAREAMLRYLLEVIESGEFGFRVYAPQVVAERRDVYRRITGDSTRHFSQIDRPNLLESGYANDLVLRDLDGQSCDYQAILDRHKGKVIYVDLWASWCGPCRAEMPEAKKLREQYKDKEVVFLYLAVRDTEEAWKGAVRSCRTDYLGENYRVLNADESLFFKQIKQHAIPRMLLYDRTGELVDPDAPRPSTDAIRTEIDRWLN